MLVKGLTKWVSWGPDKNFRLYYCIDDEKYTTLSSDWQKYLQHKVEYVYCHSIVREYKINTTHEALEKFYSLIKEFAPNYPLKKLQHEMRLKLIKNI